MHRISTIFFITLLALISCTAGAKVEKSISTDSATHRPTELPLPAVPASMTEPTDRLAFVMNHFWDEMDWRDSTLLTDSVFMEQNLANFYQLIALADSTTSAHAVDIMADAVLSSNPNVLSYITDISALYLYEPESPMYNTESYAVIIDALLARPECPDGLRMILEFEHDQTMLNRVGHRAADFRFVDRHGSRRSLHTSLGAPTTILLFYDPDCHLCADAERKLASDDAINDAITAGNVSVIAITPQEVDLDKWQTHAANLPDTWTVGYSPDGAIDRDDIYAIRALPSFYLLSSDGTILLRDAASIPSPQP